MCSNTRQSSSPDAFLYRTEPYFFRHNLSPISELIDCLACIARKNMGISLSAAASLLRVLFRKPHCSDVVGAVSLLCLEDTI